MTGNEPDAPPRGPEDRPVAALLGDIEDFAPDGSYYGEMLSAMKDGLAAAGVPLEALHCQHDYQRRAFLGRQERFRGVVFTGGMYTAKAFIAETVERLVGPAVMLDHHFDDLAMHSVRDDSVSGLRALTEHLVELGHRDFAYLDCQDLNANPWKRLGVNLALRAAGLKPLNQDRIASARSRNASDAAAALEWLLNRRPRPTAVICYDDFRAAILIAAARDKGLAVPGALSVTGYGDAGAHADRPGDLTTARVDIAALGRRAAELLLGPADAAPTSVLIPPELVIRTSTGAPGTGG